MNQTRSDTNLSQVSSRLVVGVVVAVLVAVDIIVAVMVDVAVDDTVVVGHAPHVPGHASAIRALLHFPFRLGQSSASATPSQLAISIPSRRHIWA